MPLLYQDSADRAIKPGLTDALNLILTANQTFFISNHGYFLFCWCYVKASKTIRYRSSILFSSWLISVLASILRSSNIDRLITLLSVVQPTSFSLLCLWHVWLNAFGLTTETEVRIPTKNLKKSSEIESLAFHTQANWWLMALQIVVKKCFVLLTKNKT